MSSPQNFNSTDISASLPPTSAADLIFIMDGENYEQAFINARPLSLRVIDEGRLAQHILEDGSAITDHLVNDPISIEMTMIFTNGFQDTYNEIKNAFETGKIFTIQSKTATYSSMVLTALPHEESPNYWDVIAVNLKFQQARFMNAEASGLSLADVADSFCVSTNKRGNFIASLAVNALVAIAENHFKEGF